MTKTINCNSYLKYIKYPKRHHKKHHSLKNVCLLHKTNGIFAILYACTLLSNLTDIASVTLQHGAILYKLYKFELDC